MIPDPDTVSAFAVYNGLVGTSKSKKRRSRQKSVRENLLNEEKAFRDLNKDKVSGKKKSKKQRSKSDPTVNKKNPKFDVSEGSSESVVKKSKKLLHKIKVFDSLEVEGNDTSSKNFEVQNEDPPLNNEPFIPAKSKKRPPVSNDLVTFQTPSPLKKKIKLTSQEKRDLLRIEVKKQSKGLIGSPQIGKRALETLISPVKLETFISENWEKNPLYIERTDPSYFSNYLSSSEIDDLLRYNNILFGKNLDVTSYSDGVRETHNPVGRAYPHVVWDYYSNGCSIRLLNPQTYLPKIHTLLATLQEYFGCFVGSNVYLTPPNSQGFAPHYDDIEAFVLQIEGKKEWKIYKPRTEEECLPRFSSPNFNENEIGQPILEIELNPGDILYFPRGYIHQANTLPGQHSLHITVSVYQKTAWVDLLDKVLPVALERASKSCLDYRKGLPIGYLKQAGQGYKHSSGRRELLSKLKKMVSQLEKYVDIDDAVDKMGLKFMHQALPPVLSEDEVKCTVQEGGLKMIENGRLINRVDLQMNTNVRWIRVNACRLVEEYIEGEGYSTRLYFTVDNSKEYEGEDPQFLEIPEHLIEGVRHLNKSYPAFTPVDKLPCKTDEDKLNLAGDLWERGLLLTNEPLSEDESSNSVDSDFESD